jgi:hypothetical protein
MINIIMIMNSKRRCSDCFRPLLIKKPYMRTYCDKECHERSGSFKPKKEFYCTECHQIFKPTENYQYTCLDCKEKLRIRLENFQEERLNIFCASCKKNFRRKKIESGQTQCDNCSRQKQKIRMIERSEKNNIESMKENRRTRGNGISYEKLIAIEEKKRLFDEKFANSYIRGNTKNKI